MSLTKTGGFAEGCPKQRTITTMRPSALEILSDRPQQRWSESNLDRPRCRYWGQKSRACLSGFLSDDSLHSATRSVDFFLDKQEQRKSLHNAQPGNFLFQHGLMARVYCERGRVAELTVNSLAHPAFGPFKPTASGLHNLTTRKQPSVVRSGAPLARRKSFNLVRQTLLPRWTQGRSRNITQQR